MGLRDGSRTSRRPASLAVDRDMAIRGSFVSIHGGFVAMRGAFVPLRGVFASIHGGFVPIRGVFVARLRGRGREVDALEVEVVVDQDHLDAGGGDFVGALARALANGDARFRADVGGTATLPGGVRSRSKRPVLGHGKARAHRDAEPPYPGSDEGRLRNLPRLAGRLPR